MINSYNIKTSLWINAFDGLVIQEKFVTDILLLNTAIFSYSKKIKSFWSCWCATNRAIASLGKPLPDAVTVECMAACQLNHPFLWVWLIANGAWGFLLGLTLFNERFVDISTTPFLQEVCINVALLVILEEIDEVLAHLCLLAYQVCILFLEDNSQNNQAKDSDSDAHLYIENCRLQLIF